MTQQRPQRPVVNPHIVIIGGMGPQASLALHQRLIDRSAALGTVDPSDYPQISHFSVPVPDLISSAQARQTALTQITDAITGLRLAANTVVVIACNTAHLLLTELEHVLAHRIESLVTVTVDELRNRGLSTVGVLASPSTIALGLYSSPLKQTGIQLISPEAHVQSEIEAIIRSVVANEPLEGAITAVSAMVSRLVDDGAQAVVLGCTELSLFAPLIAHLPVIDPLQLIVDKLLPGESCYREPGPPLPTEAMRQRSSRSRPHSA